MPGDTLILTDSCCDVPQHLAKKLGIRKIPVHVMYPEKDYLDGIDIDPQMVYDRFPGEIPTTSTPSMVEITDLFRSLEAEGIRKVLSIHISEHLSSTVNMVRSVAKVRGGSHCGMARLFEEVFSQVENGTDDDVPCDVIIPYGGAKEEAQLLEEMIKSKKKNANVLFQMQITASMAVHTGPGLLGLCALRRD